MAAAMRRAVCQYMKSVMSCHKVTCQSCQSTAMTRRQFSRSLAVFQEGESKNDFFGLQIIVPKQGMSDVPDTDAKAISLTVHGNPVKGDESISSEKEGDARVFRERFGIVRLDGKRPSHKVRGKRNKQKTSLEQTTETLFTLGQCNFKLETPSQHINCKKSHTYKYDENKQENSHFLREKSTVEMRRNLRKELQKRNALKVENMDANQTNTFPDPSCPVEYNEGRTTKSDDADQLCKKESMIFDAQHFQQCELYEDTKAENTQVDPESSATLGAETDSMLSKSSSLTEEVDSSVRKQNRDMDLNTEKTLDKPLLTSSEGSAGEMDFNFVDSQYFGPLKDCQTSVDMLPVKHPAAHCVNKILGQSGVEDIRDQTAWTDSEVHERRKQPEDITRTKHQSREMDLNFIDGQYFGNVKECQASVEVLASETCRNISEIENMDTICDGVEKTVKEAPAANAELRGEQSSLQEDLSSGKQTVIEMDLNFIDGQYFGTVKDSQVLGQEEGSLKVLGENVVEPSVRKAKSRRERRLSRQARIKATWSADPSSFVQTSTSSYGESSLDYLEQTSWSKSHHDVIRNSETKDNFGTGNQLPGNIFSSPSQLQDYFTGDVKQPEFAEKVTRKTKKEEKFRHSEVLQEFNNLEAGEYKDYSDANQSPSKLRGLNSDNFEDKTKEVQDQKKTKKQKQKRLNKNQETENLNAETFASLAQDAEAVSAEISDIENTASKAGNLSDRLEDLSQESMRSVHRKKKKVTEDLTGTAYETAMKIRSEFQRSARSYLLGEYRPTQVDNKGFRILTNQVPDFTRVPAGEIVDLLHEGIVYDDNDIVAINKPYSLPSIDGRGVVHSVSGLLGQLAKKLDRNLEKLHLIHRLDKETTGVMLLAKTEEMAMKLSDAFMKKRVIKKYLAITKNIPQHKAAEIDIPIKVTKASGDSYISVLRPHNAPDLHLAGKVRQVGKEAVTEYRVLSEGKDCALLECIAKTGLKHQVRVHLAMGIDCPILGDHKYSTVGKLVPQKLPEEMLKRLKIRQSKVRHVAMHLHAHTILLPEFIDGTNVFIRAPLPRHFMQNMKSLKLKLDKRKP